MTEEATPVRGRLVRPPAQDGVTEPPKLFIATPAYGGQVTVPYLYGLLNLTRSLDASGLKFHVAILFNESLVTRARNRLVAQFLRSDCTHLVFIDADVGFSARDLKPLIESDLEVVCGAYPMKSIGWQNIVDAVRAGADAKALLTAGARYAVNPTAAGTNGAAIEGIEKAGATFIEVQDAATGFLVIKRSVLERFIEQYRSEIEYVADYEPDKGQIHHLVFQADRDPVQLAQGVKARYLSEDYWFSRKWQMMGGQIWLCLDAALTHTGSYVFEGNVGELFLADAPHAPAAPPLARPMPHAPPISAPPAPLEETGT